MYSLGFCLLRTALTSQLCLCRTNNTPFARRSESLANPHSSHGVAWHQQKYSKCRCGIWCVHTIKIVWNRTVLVQRRYNTAWYIFVSQESLVHFNFHKIFCTIWNQCFACDAIILANRCENIYLYSIIAILIHSIFTVRWHFSGANCVPHMHMHNLLQLP